MKRVWARVASRVRIHWCLNMAGEVRWATQRVLGPHKMSAHVHWVLKKRLKGSHLSFGSFWTRLYLKNKSYFSDSFRANLYRQAHPCLFLWVRPLCDYRIDTDLEGTSSWKLYQLAGIDPVSHRTHEEGLTQSKVKPEESMSCLVKGVCKRSWI